MAGGRKRTADEATTTPEKRETRSAKSAKTDNGAALGKPKSAAGKQARGAAKLKTSVGQSAFLERALPLHVNLTHTPPALLPDGARVPAADADPGFLGTTALVPSAFATGSYGWKGNKRLTLELPVGPEGGGAGKEKLHVMVTINATVIGSKEAKDGAEKEAEEDAETDETPAESTEAEGAPAPAEGEAAPAEEGEKMEAEA